METMEAERELPPIMQLAFRQNPKAAEWNRMSPSHRRVHLFSIFHYREPEARARRLAKAIEEIAGRKPERGTEKDFSDTSRAGHRHFALPSQSFLVRGGKIFSGQDWPPATSCTMPWSSH